MSIIHIGTVTLELFKRGWRYFRRHGFLCAIAQTFDKLGRVWVQMPNRCAELFISTKRIRLLNEAAKGKQVFVIIPCIDWHIPLFQRPHQIAAALARRKDSVVFFIPDQYRYDNFCFSQKLSDNMYLFSARAVWALNRILSGGAKITVVMCWTRQFNLLSRFRYDRLVYEYIDELDLFYYYDKNMETIHRTLLSKADLTTATAVELYKKAEPIAKKIIFSPNAADYDFFSRQRNCAPNPKISGSVGRYSIVLGYYGALAAWFDYALILEVARRRGDWLFVLVGYDFDGSLSRLDDAALPNILKIGAQPYRELPSYISGCDVMIIPFLINKVTVATSPVKLFEYMACQKPILTSELPECARYGSVTRYRESDAVDFEQKVLELYAKRRDPEYLELLDREARENTWQERVERILTELRDDVCTS